MTAKIDLTGRLTDNTGMLRILLTMTLLCSVGLLMIAQPVHAARVLTDDEIQQIRDTCRGSQVVLRELANTDALLRVNLGQRYENIASDFMVPLNNRLASNQIDASALTYITTDYNAVLRDYKSQYFAYYNTLESTITMDCQAKPVEFYSHIETLRADRDALGEQIMTINTQAYDYQTTFREIRDERTKTAEQ